MPFLDTRASPNGEGAVFPAVLVFWIARLSRLPENHLQNDPVLYLPVFPGCRSEIMLLRTAWIALMGWSRCGDLNPEPDDYETSALPIELHRLARLPSDYHILEMGLFLHHSLHCGVSANQAVFHGHCHSP